MSSDTETRKYLTLGTETLASWNGERCILEELRVPVLDRSFMFGDAAYEVMRAYQGKPWRIERHLDRFARTLAGLRIRTDLARFERRLRELLTVFGDKDAMIYAHVTRGVGRRHPVFMGGEPNELIYIEPLASDPFASFREAGLAAMTHEDERWHRRDYKTVSLVPTCLARQKAFEAGCVECIFYEADGTVTEAGAANVFIVDAAGHLFTRPNGHHILPGVTREYVIDLARSLGYTVVEKSFDKSELWHASEVFFTSTLCQVISVTRIDDKPIRDGRPGEVVARLLQAFRAETGNHLRKGRRGNIRDE